MTSVPTAAPTPARSMSPPSRLPLRLRLKPRAAPTGRVDGGWWPRSRDLTAELPSLLEVLTVRLGRVERVTYNLGQWKPIKRKVEIGGVLVRLGGFHTQHADTLLVYGALGQVTLLVVPPEARRRAAHDALMTAGSRGNATEIAQLLNASRYPKDGS
jgi:hypothetical protein